MTPLEAIRRDLQRLDADLVAALLVRSFGATSAPTAEALANPVDSDRSTGIPPVFHGRDAHATRGCAKASAGKPTPHSPQDRAAAARFPAAWRALRRAYGCTILPLLVPGEVHCETGSAADLVALDLLWQRVASGARVAAAKLEASSAALQAVVRLGDRAAIEAAITHPDVERRVVEHAEERARVLLAGADSVPPDEAARFAAAVGEIFHCVVIPLTKRVQIEALLAPEGPGEGT